MSPIDPDHAPGVYWFWHTIPGEEEIHRQLREMHSHGINTFLIQARSAMPLEDYLGEGYFRAYKIAMQEAKRLGMTAGIYDDYNWDSGQAGGRTVRLNDDARERHLFWSTARIEHNSCRMTVSNVHSLMYSSMGQGILDWVYEGGSPEWGDWRLFKVLAYPLDGADAPGEEVVDLTRFARITDHGKMGCAIQVDIPGELNLEGFQAAAWVNGKCLTSRLINYLSSDAVASFIQAGYEPYRQAVGEFFGDPIRYVFFDHPYAGFYDWDERCGQISSSLMFTERFPEVFLEEHQYPLEKSLLSFICRPGKETPKIRMDLFDTYGRLGRESFFGALSKWTRANGLDLTGHEMLAHVGAWGFTEGFDFLDPRTNFGADYFAIDSYRDRTAVDANNYHAQISAKIGDSVAKANGRRGCMIEQYAVSKDPSVPGGAGQWGLTLQELRAQAIRHSFMGASQFIFHAYYQTDGKPGDLTLYRNPRFDFAPGLNYEPWFQQYPLFAAENKALTGLIQTAEPHPGIAVLYPLLTWWAEDYGHIFGSESGRWFRFLTENNFPFDLVSQEQLDAASVENGCLKIGGECYQTIIFPAVTSLTSAETLEKVTELTRSGGKFIASGDLPRNTRTSGMDEKLKAGFEGLVKKSANAVYFQHLPADEDLKKSLSRIGINTVKVRGTTGHQVWLWRGKRNQDAILLCFNDSPDPDRITLTVEGFSGQPYLLDLLHASESPWLWYEQKNAVMEIHYDAEPGDLFGFVIKNEKPLPTRLVDANARVRRITASRGNKCEITFIIESGKGMTGLVESPAKPLLQEPSFGAEILPTQAPGTWQVTADAISAPLPVELTQWTLEVPERNFRSSVKLDQGWEQQGLPDYAGEGVYRCQFEVLKLEAGYIPELVLPRVETTAEAWLNGNSLGELGWPPFRWQIPEGWMMIGRNELTIKVLNTGANYYYDGTPFQPEGRQPSGLIGNPQIEFTRPVKLICQA